MTKTQLDLGSGATPRQRDGYEAFGVDIFDFGLENVRVADLALERLPFEDDSFDLVTGYDVMEHVPSFVYLPVFIRVLDGPADYAGMHRRDCMIELFNEIYRVLKPGGEFYFQSPAYLPDHNNQAVFQDPTHVFVWTPESLNYFSGDYYGHHDDYGHTSRFEKRSLDISNGHINVTLRAIKSLPAGASYSLNYTVTI